jgi:hypothetical protein
VARNKDPSKWGPRGPSTHRKASDEQIISAYQETASVWEVAKRFGMCGQSVHERLVRLGATNHVKVFSEADMQRLKSEYEPHAAGGTLAQLAASMGRTKNFICRQAGLLGLTDYARPKPYLAEGSRQRQIRWLAQHPHPRGMMGKTHGQEVKQAISDAGTARWQGMSSRERADMVLRLRKGRAEKGSLVMMPRPNTTWKAAWREIGGKRCFFRSRWEANYARYLQWLKERGEIQEWEHEPKTFWFEKVLRGTRSYLPDFAVTEKSGEVRYHEVKGWFDDRSKTKIKRMAKYHPKTKLLLIDRASYFALEKQFCRLLSGWETSKSPLPGAATPAISAPQEKILAALPQMIGSGWVADKEGRKALAEVAGCAPNVVAVHLSALINRGLLFRASPGRYLMVRST